MLELRHWDFAASLTGEQIACLIVGIDPDQIGFHRARVAPILARLRQDFENTRTWHFNQGGPNKSAQSPSAMLASVELLAPHDRLARLVGTDPLRFEDQTFSREACVAWLEAIDQPSAYDFRKSHNTPSPAPQVAVSQTAIDPSDLPRELDIANMAFRAIQNGYGDQNATPRNRLFTWVDEHYANLGSEARERIVTVANPDKAPGRTKRRT